MKFLLNVFWFGKWRIRKKNKVRYYNRVQWFLDEGMSKEKIKQALYLEKLEPLRQRLNKECVSGKKRQNKLCAKKSQIKEALEAHKL